jgi:large subunit ribosomal protein L32
MVVRMRATRAHRDNRRSHDALKKPSLVKCPDCGASRVNHCVCGVCGKYKGRLVIDLAKKAAKKETKKRKEQTSVR